MEKGDFESHGKEQSKLNSAIEANKGGHTLTDGTTIKTPFHQYNVAIVKNKQDSNKDPFTIACLIGTKVSTNSI